MEVQRRGLERADGGVVELACHVARECSCTRRRTILSATPPGIAATRSAMSALTAAAGRPSASIGSRSRTWRGERHRAPLDASRAPGRRAASPSRRSVVGLVHQLAPDVGAHVLERARVPDARRHPVLDVIVPQRHVAPLGRAPAPGGRAARRRTRRRSGRTGTRLRSRRAARARDGARRRPAGAPAACRPPAPGAARRGPTGRAPDRPAGVARRVATSTPSSSKSRRIEPVSVDRGVS